MNPKSTICNHKGLFNRLSKFFVKTFPVRVKITGREIDEQRSNSCEEKPCKPKRGRISSMMKRNLTFLANVYALQYIPSVMVQTLHFTLQLLVCSRINLSCILIGVTNLLQTALFCIFICFNPPDTRKVSNRCSVETACVTGV